MSDVDPGLYAKIANVIKAVEQVEKTGTNTFHGYKYATAEAVFTVIRGPLAEQGVVILPSLTSVDHRDYTTAGGKQSTITTAHVQFTFVDTETGAMHRCDWAGQGDDPADKGWGKAATNAAKTFLREAFLLPQGDDPESDPTTDERAGDRASSGTHRSSGGGLATDAQKKFLRQLITQNKLDADIIDRLFTGVGFARSEGEKVNDAINRLSKGQCSSLIEFIKEGAVPTGGTDVPAEPGFEHPVDPEPLPLEA
jgi:hypothetical protein